MPHLKSISYFTDHNLLRRMPQELLYRLLIPYAECFREHEIELPPSWTEGQELPVDAICMVLMNMKTEERSSELVEELLMLQALINGKDLIESTLNRLVSGRYAQRPELQRRDGETDADFILKLWLDDVLRCELEKLVPWLQAKTTKAFAEFTLRESLCPGTNSLDAVSGGSAADGLNALERLGISGIMQNATQGERQACERISAHFRSKGYTDFCEIKSYPSEENNEVVFIIDHGGKQQRVNTLTQEKQKDVTAFIPLINDVIVIMPDRALMRVATKMTWCESLYQEVFGDMLLHDQYAFESRPLYHFEPMFDRSPAQALALTGFHNVITGVELKSISYTESDEAIGVYTREDCQQRLMRAAYLQKGVPTTTQKVVLALTMKKRAPSRPITVTIQSGKGKGIGCSVDSFYPIITKWLTHLGFRQGFYNPRTRSLLNEAAKACDAVKSWNGVAQALQHPYVSLNYLEKVCGARTRLFLEKYLQAHPDFQKSKVWHESETEQYTLVEHDDAYSIVMPDNELNVIGEVEDIEEIVLYSIDKEALFADVYRCLGEKLRRSAEFLSTYLYGGSILASKGVSVWMFFPSTSDDISHCEIVRANRLTYSHSCIILPRGDWAKTDEWFQKVYLDELLDIDETGQLAVKGELSDNIEDRSPYNQDGPPYRKWHLAFPESRDWPHVEMKFGYDSVQQHTTIHITYGAGVKAPQAPLIHSHLPMFTKQSGDFGWKKEFLLLLQLAQRMRSQGYFERNNQMGTYLNRLANSLSEFFCIDGLFYEELPDQEGSRKRYRLKFKVDIDSSLLENPLVNAEVES